MREMMLREAAKKAHEEKEAAKRAHADAFKSKKEAKEQKERTNIKRQVERPRRCL